MRKILFILGAVIVFTACTKNTKKLIIFIHDHPVINEDAKTFASKDTMGHVEQQVEYNISGPVVLNATTSAGTAQITIPDNGYYIVNLKPNDTIVGSYQSYSAYSGQRVITQDDLKRKIDSLQLLVQGKNVSAANRNFFILPNTAAKITDNTDAIIVSPYKQMPALEMTDNKMPEVYEFYTIHEVRETIAHLQTLATEDKTPPQPVKKKR